MRKILIAFLIFMFPLLQVPGQCKQEEKTVPRLLYSGFLPLPDGKISLFGRVIWDDDYTKPLVNKRFSEFFAHNAKLFSFQVNFGSSSLPLQTDEIGDFEGTIPASMASEIKPGDGMGFSANASYTEFAEKFPFSLPANPKFLIVSDIDDTGAQLSLVVSGS